MGIAAGLVGAAVCGITSVGAAVVVFELDVAAIDRFAFGASETDLFEIKLAAVVDVVGVMALNCTRLLPTEVVLNCNNPKISIQLTWPILRFKCSSRKEITRRELACTLTLRR